MLKQQQWKTPYGRAMKLVKINDGQTNRRNRAIVLLHKTLRLNPPTTKLPVIYLNLGVLLFENSNTSEAIFYFRKSITLCPTFWKAHYDMALALVELDRLLEAKKHFEISQKLFPGLKSDADVQIKSINEKLSQEAEQAMSQTCSTRTFARDLTETIRIVADNPRKEQVKPVNNTPIAGSHVDLICQKRSSGWMHGMGTLLHKYYVTTTILGMDPMAAFEEYDFDRSGYISEENFSQLLERLGIPMTKIERFQLSSLFPSGFVWYRCLVPNDATIHEMDKIDSIDTTSLRFCTKRAEATMFLLE